MKELKRKVSLYLELTGTYRWDIAVLVQGSFQDEQGNIAFLEAGYHPIDTSLLFRQYLSVKVDNEWCKLKPTSEEGIIDAALLYIIR